MTFPFDEIHLKKLEELPEKWTSEMHNVKFTIISDYQHASWISKQIFKIVDEGTFSANIYAKHSIFSVELIISLDLVIDATIDFGVLSSFLYLLKTKSLSNYLEKQKYDRKRR
jgi:hypothetical protein